MISSIGTPSSSFGRGWRATLMGCSCRMDELGGIYACGAGLVNERGPLSVILRCERKRASKDAARAVALRGSAFGRAPQGDGEKLYYSAACFWPACTISQIRVGDSGNSRGSAPNDCSALATALAM